jgi:hypothetical protein
MKNFQPIYIIYLKSLGSIRIPKLLNSFWESWKNIFQEFSRVPKCIGQHGKILLCFSKLPNFFWVVWKTPHHVRFNVGLN